MTKDQAIEILNAYLTKTADVSYNAGARDAFEALDRAGAFQSEEVAAEIGKVCGYVSELEHDTGTHKAPWRMLALRLATACRAAGLARKAGS